MECLEPELPRAVLPGADQPWPKKALGTLGPRTSAAEAALKIAALVGFGLAT